MKTLVERLREESERLSGRSLDRGCQDSGIAANLAEEARDYIEKLARRVFVDPSRYGVVFAAEEKDDPHSELTWRKANPGYPISPTRRYLEAASRVAKNSPAELSCLIAAFSFMLS